MSSEEKKKQHTFYFWLTLPHKDDYHRFVSAVLKDRWTATSLGSILVHTSDDCDSGVLAMSITKELPERGTEPAKTATMNSLKELLASTKTTWISLVVTDVAASTWSTGNHKQPATEQPVVVFDGTTKKGVN